MLPANLRERTFRPNVVILMADDHAFEAISAYGSDLKDYARTPAIDRVAKGIKRFGDGPTICPFPVNGIR